MVGDTEIEFLKDALESATEELKDGVVVPGANKDSNDNTDVNEEEKQ